MSVRLSLDLLKALKVEAKRQDRTVGYVVRQILSAKLLKATTPKKREPVAGSAPVDGIPTEERDGAVEAFEVLWRGWVRLTHKAGTGAKQTALAQFLLLAAKVPAPSRFELAKLLVRCAGAEDKEKALEADKGRDPIKLPQLHRWLREERYKGTKTWQDKIDRHRSATTGATARSRRTSTSATGGTGGPEAPPPETLA